jgi:hypothetical protein
VLNAHEIIDRAPRRVSPHHRSMGILLRGGVSTALFQPLSKTHGTREFVLLDVRLITTTMGKFKKGVMHINGALLSRSRAHGPKWSGYSKRKRRSAHLSIARAELNKNYFFG